MTPNDNTNNKSKPPRAKDGGGGGEKLQKVIARKGKGSRREMDALIGEGKVFVNGKRAQTGARVKDGDDVKIKRGENKKPYRRKDGDDNRRGDWRKDKPRRHRADGDGDNRDRDRDRGDRNRRPRRDDGDKRGGGDWRKDKPRHRADGDNRDRNRDRPRRDNDNRGGGDWRKAKPRYRADGDGDNRYRDRDRGDRNRRPRRDDGDKRGGGDWRKDKPRHRADGDNRDRNRDRPRRDNDKRGGDDWRKDKPRRHRADGDGDNRYRDRDRPRRDNDKRGGGDWRKDKPRHRAGGDGDNRARGRDNRRRDNYRDDNRHRRPRDSKPPLQKSHGEVQILIYNKPVGTVVSREPLKGVRGKRGARPVFDDLPPIKNARWLSIGRLDVSSEGLLLFTDDGDTANRLAHPRYGAQREYLVRVNGALSQAEQQRMCKGIEDDEEVLRADEVTAHNNKESGRNQWYRVLMSSGKNRAVRRMFMFFGFRVSRLMRVRMGPYELPRDLRPGGYVFADAKLIKDEK